MKTAEIEETLYNNLSLFNELEVLRRHGVSAPKEELEEALDELIKVAKDATISCIALVRRLEGEHK